MKKSEKNNKIKKNGKRKRGRPSSYDTYYHPKVGKKLALLGMTDEEIGGYFDKTPQTIWAWKNKYEEFRVALEEGGEGANAKVAASIFERACGYSHPDYHVSTHKVKKTTTDENGNKVVEEHIKVVTVPITKHYPPDTGAAVFWLINRTRRMENPWKNTRGVEHSGEGGGPIQTQDVTAPIDLSDLTEEELEVAEKIGLAAGEKRKRERKPSEELFS